MLVFKLITNRFKRLLNQRKQFPNGLSLIIIDAVNSLYDAKFHASSLQCRSRFNIFIAEIYSRSQLLDEEL